MKRRKMVLTALIMMGMAMFNSGCAVIGAAISAGIGYAIYQATAK